MADGDRETLDAAIFGASPAAVERQALAEADAQPEQEVNEQEVQPEETQAEEVEKQPYTFKVRGEEVTQELTPEEFHAIAQKGMDYDRQMSRLDLERKQLQQQQEELAKTQSQLLAEAEAGRILKQVQQEKPHVYKQWFDALENDRIESSRPQVSALEKEVGELNELINDESAGIKEVPVFGKMANLINKLSGEVRDLRSGRTSEFNELQQKVSSLSEYTQKLEASKQQDRIQSEVNRFTSWASERNIDVKNTPEEIESMKIMINGGMDIIKAAQLAYQVGAQPQNNNVQETVTREVGPPKLKVPNRKSGTGMSDREILDKAFYSDKPTLFK